MHKHIIKTKGPAPRDHYRELPVVAITEGAVFQMLSDREILIEGVRHLDYYSENNVRIRTKHMYIRIYGRGLQLKCLAGGNMAVCGLLERLELEREHE